MKYDAVNLLRRAGRAMKRHDAGGAFAVMELANNLRLLMRKEATVDDFLKAYTGHDEDPIDLDKELPVT